MRDRAVACSERSESDTDRHRVGRMPSVFLGCAGLMGAAGVIVAAVGTHRAGGDFARTASEFLLIHAAVVTAAAGFSQAWGRRSVMIAMAMALLTAGTILFAGDLALAGLDDWRPLPLAAPIGGFSMIAGWLSLAVVGVRFALRPPR